MINIVKCPVCGKRLFDYEDGDKCKIIIKCFRCKCVSEINLVSKKQKVGA